MKIEYPENQLIIDRLEISYVSLPICQREYPAGKKRIRLDVLLQHGACKIVLGNRPKHGTERLCISISIAR